MKKRDPRSAEGLADDIVPSIAYDAPVPAAKEFLPWHRPRKQYVRQYQWHSEIKKLLDNSVPADGLLKYLGLPGTDLLDLRYFHGQLCATYNVKLRFLGFNSSAMPKSRDHTEMNISLDEVRRLPHVDPMSDIIADNFALLAKENSLACKRTRELGPYDVVNLDLCDGFGARRPTPTNSYYDAVSALLGLQSRSKTPWLLLLTTRTDRPNINRDVLNKLLGKYIDNLAACESFRESSREQFALETEQAIRKASATPDGLLSIFLIGLCKWLLGLALEYQPPITVELRSVVGYRVDGASACEDLISLALRFTPTFVPAEDPLGLANNPAAVPDECVLATRMIRRVAKRIDADQKLRDDEALNQKMIDGTAELLALARYNTDEYREWARSG